MLIGKIVKGIGGFYYVAANSGINGENCPEDTIYETKARGLFRKDGVKPLVGDDCEMEIIDQEKRIGNVISILPRRSKLIRPAVANADQAIVIFALSNPEPHTGLIDRYLVGMAWQEMPVILVLNKADEVETSGNDASGDIERDIERDPKERPAAAQEMSRGAGRSLKEIYRNAGFRVIETSAKTGEGIEELRQVLKGKTSVLSGPSGVGKSSLLNAIFPDYQVKTGEISEKIGRGKHTTRHSELMAVGQGTFLCDTPGFSSVELPEEMTEELLPACFPEFEEYLGKCRFNTCRHMAEPDCAVKAAVQEGRIEPTRYESYQGMIRQLRGQRRY